MDSALGLRSLKSATEFTPRAMFDERSGAGAPLKQHILRLSRGQLTHRVWVPAALFVLLGGCASNEIQRAPEYRPLTAAEGRALVSRLLPPNVSEP